MLLNHVELERRAVDAERASKTSSSSTAALAAALESAELYLQAFRQVHSIPDRKRLNAKCKELLNEAEKLKSSRDGLHQLPDVDYPVSSRPLTTREKIIVLEGSKLNGYTFKPWKDAPSQNEFNLPSGNEMYIDSPQLAISETHKELFGGWRRPGEALGFIEIEVDGQKLSTDPCMTHDNSRVDLVQDLTSDCSVVASLCAGTARAEHGHAKISGSIIYPYDHERNAVLMSPNGKYVLKLYFNGCWRRVEIDDLLPTTTNARVLHVVDRSHPGLLWPALLEKAYLKVRGGYDFPGSNSGTDLAVLTGWIPQQVFLHDADIDPNHLWNEISGAFKNGDIFVTMGTGKLSRKEQKQSGLAAEHDYAVLDMKDDKDVREVLIKNPWADGDVWKGAALRKPHPHHEDDEQYPELPPAEGSNELLPGTFWMDLNNVFQHYENLYINWNPTLFKQRHDQHFSWNLTHMEPVSSIMDQYHQFSVQAMKAEEVWILLNRHFRTGDYTHENSGRNGYISLYLFDASGARVLSSSGARIRGPFVDSPNTLLRFRALAGQAYTVVAAQQDLPAGKHNFTISLFSKFDSLLQTAQEQFNCKEKFIAAWTKDTSGGNSDSPNYLLNPQFSLVLDKDQEVALVLKVLDSHKLPAIGTEIHVKISVTAGDGQRVTRLRPRDIVAHSGDYHRGSTVLEKALPRGQYTIICSTFANGDLSAFSLDVYNKSAAKVSHLPSEDSGRLRIRAPEVIFNSDSDKYLAPLSLGKISRCIFIARQGRHRPSTSALFRLSIEKGQGPYKTIVADSSLDDKTFQPLTTGLRIEDTALDSSFGDGGLWLVLERLATASLDSENAESIQVEILAENNVEIGPWGTGAG